MGAARLITLSEWRPLSAYTHLSSEWYSLPVWQENRAPVLGQPRAGREERCDPPTRLCCAVKVDTPLFSVKSAHTAAGDDDLRRRVIPHDNIGGGDAG